MEQKQPILHGNYYHIYNRGNNGIDVFLENESYYHFLRLYAKYVDPVAETFAWCLLKNHFHLLVRIKNKNEIDENQLTYNTTEKPKVIDPSRQFSHLLNAYTQAINKRHNRTGSLFETTFERKIVADEKYLRKLIFYIHNNPVHHGFVKQMSLYPWSSYETVMSNKPTKLMRAEVIELYSDLENFVYFHDQQQSTNEISNLIIEY
jgi:REP element-mobilizing transposase RayT